LAWFSNGLFEHRDELLADWELAQVKKPLRDISPLV
jgi:hypothetical protein